VFFDYLQNTEINDGNIEEISVYHMEETGGKVNPEEKTAISIEEVKTEVKKDIEADDE
jgi:hypothetical protein